MQNPVYDLHSHSLESDGSLSPEALVIRAKEKGVTTLALTDHDTVSGLDIAHKAAQQQQLELISGIEFSCTWQHKTFHIVGLNIDHHNPELLAGAAHIQAIRNDRAKKISAKLAKKNIPDVFERLSAQENLNMITRTHLANFLFEHNYVDSFQAAFNYYLAQGKPAFVSTEWATLEQVTQWIHQAGGVAVLAHPMRYKMTASWMRRFLTAFTEQGGQGIEVITARSNPDEIRRTIQFAKQFNLYASVGSDFHNTTNQWVELGRLAPLPVNIKPVWDLF